MIILIPLGGLGQRFKKEGYNIPKALIKVKNKKIIFHLLDNLILKNNISYIYIPYNKEYVNYNFEEMIIEKYQNYKFKFLVLENQTRGAAETIHIALSHLFSKDIHYPINVNQMKSMFDKPILCLDSDNFYKTDIIKMWNGKNCVFTFHSKNQDAKFSYIEHDEETGNITNIIEKEKISDNACCGAYGFSSYYDLMNYCEKIIHNNIRQKNEFYTSGVIKEMINNGIAFTNKNIENKYYYSLGTPDQIKLFEHGILLDLDGTLVNTDHIYVKVWNKILQKFNLSCDFQFFNSFIKGKSDVNFLTYLLNDINGECLHEISELKDEYFIEFIEMENNVLYDGVLDFFDTIQNLHIAIVTSCNRKAAEYILKKFNLEKYVDLLITSEDVVNHKPHPEPYLKAAELLNISLNNCLIFEDSYSGYISAMKANPHKVCIYDNKSNHFIKELNCFKFDNYKNIDIINIINIQEVMADNMIENIKETLKYLPITSIQFINDSNLKTGYICDIDKCEVIFFNNEKQNIIVKISNDGNELSKVAKKLNMYYNEIYFYEHISHIITNIITNIKIPKFLGSFQYKNRNAFIMEDLNIYNGKFNIDLNKNVTILLSIVNNIFHIHNTFYFTDEDNIINSMKSLKKMNQISYYKELINERFDKFLNKNNQILTSQESDILIKIYKNFDNILNNASQFPLSFCHGDLKSPNIFYKNNKEPYFLDWQYIHLNKGISDIVFLLVESINFNKTVSDLVLNYYFSLLKEKRENILYDDFIADFKDALCTFPFFVIVWFNSEDPDKLIDKSFPLKFMKNVLKYYKYYL